MALTNIFREPRREITESVIGITIIGALGYADLKFARWLQEVSGPGYNEVPWPLGMMVGLLVAAVFIFLLFLTHEVGDSICDALAERGLELRPKNRPGRR